MKSSEDTKSTSSTSHITNRTISPQSSKRITSSRSSVSVMRPHDSYEKSIDIAPPDDKVEKQSKLSKDRPVAKAEDMCECGPLLYGRVLGATADEALLTGLKTIVDLCNKLTVCDGKTENQAHTALSNDLQNIPERDGQPSTHSQTDSKDVKTSKSQTASKSLSESKSQTQRNMVSAGFQVNPATKDESVQTDSLTEMISEILQTVGLTPELANKIMQTSVMELPVEKKASLISMYIQTSNLSVLSGAAQTINPEVKSGIAQTSSFLLPTIPEAVEKPLPPPPPQPNSNPTPRRNDSTTQSDQTKIASKLTMVDKPETPTPPPHRNNSSQSEDIKAVSKLTMITNSNTSINHPPPVKNESVMTQSDKVETASKQTMIIRSSSSIKSVRIQPSIESQPVLSREQSRPVSKQLSKGDEHKCISPPEPPVSKKVCKCCRCSSSSGLDNQETEKSNGKKKSCSCSDRKRSKCRCSSSTPNSPPSDMSIVGDTKAPLEVRYAITRNSKYKEYTTFEVLKSTSHLPRHIPKHIEGVFVLKGQSELHSSGSEKS